MRPGREFDTRIAIEVFGYDVWVQNDALFENAPLGERPLRRYTQEIEWAMEVAKHLHIAILPIAGGEWFAFVGPQAQDGWASPTAMLEFLEAGNFNDCGAAVNNDLPQAICEAALKAVEKRQALEPVKQESQAPQLSVVERTEQELH